MNNIDVPQYTTINDVLNANKGDRLSTFADFLNNPQTMRTIGNFLPSYGYNPKTGKVNNLHTHNRKTFITNGRTDRKIFTKSLKLQCEAAGIHCQEFRDKKHNNKPNFYK